MRYKHFNEVALKKAASFYLTNGAECRVASIIYVVECDALLIEKSIIFQFVGSRL